MKKVKIVGIVLIVGLIILQMLPSKLPEVVLNNPNDLLANNTISDSISKLLKKSCYDCHSNVTVYPWYSHVAPVSFLVGRDTRIGREHLNFSEWETFTIKEKLKILSETADVIENKEMPFPPYMLMHGEAKLSASDRSALINWTEQFGDQLLQ